MKALVNTACSKLWQFIYPRCKGLSLGNNLQHEILGESVFPDHNSIKLYESVFWLSFIELPKTCQEQLLLHWKEYSDTDIGTLLHIDVDSVPQRKTRCTQLFLKSVMNHPDYQQFTEAT